MDVNSKIRPITIVNSPPGVVPEYFEGRHDETKIIADFLKNEDQSLMTVVGRGGTGKTVMICRILKAIENKKSLNGIEMAEAEAIAYFSMKGSRHISFENIFYDLCSILPEEDEKRLDRV